MVCREFYYWRAGDLEEIREAVRDRLLGKLLSPQINTRCLTDKSSNPRFDR